MLRVIIFNVERGFCAYVKTPNDYSILIDCGKSSTFSPIEYIKKHELDKVEKINNKSLAEFIVSHPHDDHISDIKQVIALNPAIIYGRKYDWDKIKDPEKKFEYDNLDAYSEWRDGLSSFGGSEPDWGVEIVNNLGLSIPQAKAINKDRLVFVNNSSIIIMLNYKGHKFFFPGDLMSDGWETLLKQESFKKALEGTCFLIASHHGHSSGYTSEIFKVCKPWVNIVSEKSGEDIDPAYSSKENASGVKIGDEVRRMLTTRKDCSIIIQVDENGKWYYNTF
jgi:beta-lactamase superfamily II metal-dependent hydrolase